MNGALAAGPLLNSWKVSGMADLAFVLLTLAFFAGVAALARRVGGRS